MDTSPIESPVSKQSSSTTPATPVDHPLRWQSAGKMVKEDGSVRLLDSYIWASVFDEVSRHKILEESDV